MPLDAPPLDPHLSWDDLIRECDQIKAKLQLLSDQLERHWIKRRLLGKATRRWLQQEIQRVSVKITAVRQAAHEVKSTHQLEALRQLEANIQHLSTEKSALQTGLPCPPKTGLVSDVISVLTPFVATAWGVLLKLGVLTSTAVWVTAVPLVVGMVILFKTTIQRLLLRLLSAKMEDRIALVEQIDDIIRIFEKIEEKMHASDTRALRFETTELRSDTKALQSDTKALQQTSQITLDKVNLLADQLAKLEEENIEIKKTNVELTKTNVEIKKTNVEIKEMMAELLKEIRGKSS